jgi:alkylation response protein AidB-like acyl-CoA dehydrogenase
MCSTAGSTTQPAPPAPPLTLRLHRVRDEEGRDASVIVPTGREGLHVKDDRDGMGQRPTASCSLEFDGLEIHPDEVVHTAQRSLQRRDASSLRRLYLVAVAGGIVRNVFQRCVALRAPACAARRAQPGSVCPRRPFHAVGGRRPHHPHPRGGRADRGQRAPRPFGGCGGAATTTTPCSWWSTAKLATTKTQLAVGRIALQAAERLFDAGGASATLRQHNLDRHRRNLRTIFNHRRCSRKRG